MHDFTRDEAHFMGIDYIVGAVFVVWGIVNFTAYRSVQLLSRPDKLLVGVDYINDEAFLSEERQFSAWCLSNNFMHEKRFLFYGILNGSPIKCSAWWSSTTSTWALIYVTPTGRNVDFVTTYKNRVGVTTASSKDSLTLPSAPKSYLQAFTNIGNNELYALHKHAVSGVEAALHLSEVAGKLELFDQIEQSVLRQVDYIRTIPFWYLRGAYWYFISRNLKVNKKVRL